MVQIRKSVASDHEFLWRLHKATFEAYVDETWGWDEAWQRQNFLSARDLGRYDIIVLDGVAIGGIRVDDNDDGVFLDYISFLPEFQNRGLGTALVRRILRDAGRRQVPVKLRVLKVNPARGLYERLGFRVVGGDEFRHYMEASPGSDIQDEKITA
jgi:ribosomal protein S18 acetylase RimI-like enzyme